MREGIVTFIERQPARANVCGKVLHPLRQQGSLPCAGRSGHQHHLHAGTQSGVERGKQPMTGNQVRGRDGEAGFDSEEGQSHEQCQILCDIFLIVPVYRESGKMN